MRRIPFVPQATSADCGSACLAMVLAWHRCFVSVDAIRSATGAGHRGTTAAALFEAAGSFGLRGRGFEIAPGDVGKLGRGVILHWAGRHFVVLDRVGRSRVRILDPAIGPRSLSSEKFSRSFSGTALVFEPTVAFRPIARTASPAARYFREVLRQPRLLAALVLTTLALQGLALAAPLLTGALVDRIVPQRELRLLELLVVGAAGLAAGTFAANVMRSLLLLRLRLRLDRILTVRFVRHLVDLPHGFFVERPAGDLMMRLNSNSIVREILTSGALSGLLDGALVATYLVALLLASPTFGVAVGSLGALRIGVVLALRRRQGQAMAATLEKEAQTRSLEAQMLAGMETLKASGIERRWAERWEALFVETQDAIAAQGRLGAWLEAAMALLTACSPVVVLLLGAALVLRGELTMGQMLALAALSAGFLGPLAALASTTLRFQLVASYMQRIADILDSPVEQPSGGARISVALRGAVDVQNVAFRYAAAGPDVLRGVAFPVPAGSFLAIVGPSGSGKSTLGRLLLGLYRPTAGRILLDGIDLTRLDLRSVREQVGVVTQRSTLFGETIRECLTLGSADIGTSDLEAACRLAEIHDDILALPLGYETRLAEGGASLSGGQRQRLALARALARRPALLLLDEATSELDAVTEARIQRNLAALPRTRIVIAHRLSTVAGADSILVLDRGRMTERGSHRELLGANGLYAGLVRMQRPADSVEDVNEWSGAPEQGRPVPAPITSGQKEAS